ncbi:hypothetical protein GCM10023262_05000 [Bartonella pachyuromydis]|uniref:Uncharacterized protein n=1 Tax=Bartonella pachyuromydis TaxID=931097 RepID=A0ABP8VDP7_9HYPH
MLSFDFKYCTRKMRKGQSTFSFDTMCNDTIYEHKSAIAYLGILFMRTENVLEYKFKKIG